MWFFIDIYILYIYLYMIDRLFVCQCMQNAVRKVSGWQEKSLSITGFLYFFCAFFGFLESLTDKKSVSNTKLQPFTFVFFDLWRVFFTSVASILCFFFYFFWSWHNIFTSAFIFAWCWHILFMSLQWFSLIFLYWHMFFMSVQRISQKACFFIPLT